MMRLLVLYPRECRLDLDSITKMCQSLSVNLVFIPWDKKWNLDEDKSVRSILFKTSHLLVVSRDRPPQGNLYYYAVGFFEKYKHGHFLLAMGSYQPSFNSEKVLLNTMDLFQQLKELKQQWKISFTQEAAKQKIEEKGVELSVYALFEAICEGNEELTKLFLTAGYSVNLKNKNGITLLGLACRKGHPVLSSFLLDKGANINLESEDRGNTPLMDACAEGYEEIVELLVNRGAQLDKVSKNGQTALMLSIGQGYDKIAEILVREGADTSIKDKLGMDAKTYASLFKKKSILFILNSNLS